VSSKPLMKPSGIAAIAIGSAIALAVAGIGIFAYLTLRPSPEASTTAAAPTSPPSDTQNAVSALGRLQAGFDGPLKIAAPSTFGSSRVLRMLVKEGTTVKAGQPIAVMDSYPSLSAALAQAQAQGLEAQARLEQVRAGAKQGDISAQQTDIPRAEAEQRKATIEFKAANLEREKAKWEYESYRDLAKQGAVSQLELKNREITFTTAEKEFRQAEQALEQAEQSLAQAKAKLNSIAEVRPTDIRQAEAQVQIAVANFERAKVDQENAIVRSPFDGQVIKLHANEGETVGSDGILELGRTEQMFAVAEVDENDIRRVKVGQKATITGDAFRDETLTGTVVDIGRQIGKKAVLNTDPVDKVDTRVIEVKIRLDDSKKVANLTNLQVKVAIGP
jgi:HlyD family secretion protein